MDKEILNSMPGTDPGTKIMTHFLTLFVVLKLPGAVFQNLSKNQDIGLNLDSLLWFENVI